MKGTFYNQYDRCDLSYLAQILDRREIRNAIWELPDDNLRNEEKQLATDFIESLSRAYRMEVYGGDEYIED